MIFGELAASDSCSFEEEVERAIELSSYHVREIAEDKDFR